MLYLINIRNSFGGSLMNSRSRSVIINSLINEAIASLIGLLIIILRIPVVQGNTLRL